MAAVLVVLARWVLIATLLAAPWAIGGAELWTQPWLFGGALAAAALAWLAGVCGAPVRLSASATLLLALAALLIAIGAWQLAPHPHAPVLAHAELTTALHILDGDDTPATARSLYPAATRVQMGRMALALCAFVAAAWVFTDRAARQRLWVVLAVNGVALAGFGLVQRTSWNGRLFWTIPLQLGGQPFASFVNRNNAAEYLSLCLAGAVGLWFAGRARADNRGAERISTAPQPAETIVDRLPATTWSVLILLLFGGVLATLSRGGAVSAAAGMVVVGVWAVTGRRTRLVVWPLLGIVVAAAVWIGLSQQGGALRVRLGSLSTAGVTDGRVQHWADMRDALHDFPQWGTGWGTYRYANKPYESRASESWYESADNQYLEWAVEGGAGAAVIVALVWLVGAGVAVGWRRVDEWGESTACAYMLTAVGLQSFADCWWNTSATLLTLATLAGALSAPGRRLDDAMLSPIDKVRLLLESRRGRVSSAVMGLCVLLAAGLGWREVDAAAQSSLLRRRVPEDSSGAELAALEIDGLLAEGDRLLARRPDDAELQAALARLHYLGYRVRAATVLSSVAPVRWSAAARWERTSPEALFATLARYRQIGDAAALARFRESPPAEEHLTAMAEHVRAARRSCPILPHLGLYEALAELLAEHDPSPALRREAALSPARVALLHALARSAEMIGDAELFAVCLRRCLVLDPEQTLTYVETARRRLAEPAIVAELLPAQPGPLLDVAESARSAAGRALAVELAARSLVKPDVTEAVRRLSQGRIAWLRGDTATAIDEFAAAAAADPLNPRVRWHYARALHARGDTAAAREQLEIARRRATTDRRLKSELDRLERAIEAERAR